MMAIYRKFGISDVASGIELVIGLEMSIYEASELIGCSQLSLRNWIEKHYYNKPKQQRRIEIMVLQSKINEI